MSQDLVNDKTLSRLLDVPRETIKFWRAKGLIPWVKLPGTKLVRYPLKEIREWYQLGWVPPVK